MVRELDDRVALDRDRCDCRFVTAVGLDEAIDHVAVVAVDEGRHRMSVEIIQPAALQREAGTGQISNLRGEVELAGEPRFDRVLIGREDVQQMIGHQ